MDAIFMNSENIFIYEFCKTSDSHRLLLNVSDKVNLKGFDKYIALSNLKTIHGKLVKSCTKTINLKYQLQREMKSLNYLLYHDDFQQDIKFLHIFVPNKSLGQLIEVSPKWFIFLKTFNSEFLYIEFKF